MSSALNRVLLPPRTLMKGCAIAGVLALVQASMVFGVTHIMASMLAPGAVANPKEMHLIGKGILAMLVMPGVLAAWIIMLKSENFGGGVDTFLSQLPVSRSQLHHARISADLVTVLTPVGISLAIFLLAAVADGVAPEVGALALHLLSGLLLGVAVFELPLLSPYAGALKKFCWFVIALIPSITLLYFASFTLTAVSVVLALALFFYSWNQLPQTKFAAPLQFVADQAAGQQRMIQSGRKTLRKWILRHTLFQWRFLLMAPFMVIYPFMDAGNIDYSRNNQMFMVFYFLGFMTYSVAMVTQKLEFLPLSKKQILPYLLLPLLPMLTLGVVLTESANVGWMPGFEPEESENPDFEYGLPSISPILVTGDQSFVSDQSVQRLVVPPQLLKVSSSGETPSLLAETGIDFSPPALPLLWSGGPSLYSPFDIPEWGAELNPIVLTSQLEQALTAFYGTSPPASVLQERFIKLNQDGSLRFKETDFDKWQYEWAADLEGAFQTQADYWHEQAIYLMPARAIGWIAGWGFVLCLAFLLRARYVNKGRFLLQRCVIWIGGISFTLYLTKVTRFFTESVRTDGFQERLLMLPSQIVRDLLPANQALAWIAVAMFFGIAYYLVYRTYRNTEWTSTPTMTGIAKRQYMKWQKI